MVVCPEMPSSEPSLRKRLTVLSAAGCNSIVMSHASSSERIDDDGVDPVDECILGLRQAIDAVDLLCVLRGGIGIFRGAEQLIERLLEFAMGGDAVSQRRLRKMLVQHG